MNTRSRLLFFYRLFSSGSATLLVALAGILLRLTLLFFVGKSPLQSDAGSYFQMGQRLAAGEHFLPFWPPGLPLYLALIHKLFSPSEMAARLSMLAFHVLLGTAVYLTGRRVSPFVANMALLLLSLSPAMLYVSVETLTELPAATFLAVLALLLLLIRKSKPLPVMLCAGAALGALVLVRPSSLLLAVLLPLMLAWKLRKIAVAPVALGVTAALVFTWAAHVHRTTGQWILINTANAKNFYLGNNPYTPVYRTWWLGSHHELEQTAIAAAGQPASNPVEHDRMLNQAAWKYIRQRPDLFVLRTFNRVCVLFAADTFAGRALVQNEGLPAAAGLLYVAAEAMYYCLLGVGAISFWFSKGRTGSGSMTPLLVAGVLLYLFPYTLSFSHPRYHIPVEPLMMLAAAAWLDRYIAAPGSAVAGDENRALRTICISIFLVIQIEFIVILARTASSG